MEFGVKNAAAMHREASDTPPMGLTGWGSGMAADEKPFMVFSGWPHVGWAFLVMSGRTTTFRE